MLAPMAAKKKSASKKGKGTSSSSATRGKKASKKTSVSKRASASKSRTSKNTPSRERPKSSKTRPKKIKLPGTVLGSTDPRAVFDESRKKTTLPLFVVHEDDFAGWRDSAPASISGWLTTREFRPRPGATSLLPGEEGPAGAVVVVGTEPSPWDFANLPRALPPGSYEAEPELEEERANALALGWALGSYRFDRYKKKKRSKLPRLVWPDTCDVHAVFAQVEGTYLTRDLINTPASDMGPHELARAARRIAERHEAKYSTIVGDQLLKKNYPMLHAVGRASSYAPRLIDLTWGKAKHPRVTLVGKGVCFDSGGLDLKPAAYMKLMKKDMGGAACVLGLAHAIMAQKLPVRLRVLVPAVENSIGGNAMRPLDVLQSRKGITVEVGDTDAEGRLILADALAEAESEDPDLVIDAATLTGAARVALGTGMPAIFSNLTKTWQSLDRAAQSSFDPLWRLPLHEPYRRQLDSKVADLSNIGTEAYGGAIIAALFLREFVSKQRDWVHMDTMGYNTSTQAGRPAGGEAMGLRALLAMLRDRYQT